MAPPPDVAVLLVAVVAPVTFKIAVLDLLTAPPLPAVAVFLVRASPLLKFVVPELMFKAAPVVALFCKYWASPPSTRKFWTFVTAGKLKPPPDDVMLKPLPVKM